ncbi:hypothetical protein OESDEN_00698 [Oesophagostomum dentatum]|uniref:Uncharacterized protein n=1 Tax=Oesophagostomum dentatum TaxID=61180 RepID=A0A0B1TP36_OESDE|nr:hypothetical protein OESDEN_00698 [Oesophagostomum dentatum]
MPTKSQINVQAPTQPQPSPLDTICFHVILFPFVAAMLVFKFSLCPHVHKCSANCFTGSFEFIICEVKSLEQETGYIRNVALQAVEDISTLFVLLRCYTSVFSSVLLSLYFALLLKILVLVDLGQDSITLEVRRVLEQQPAGLLFSCRGFSLR